ncbi:MAG TPA: carboxypeptidase regulatory-like domain-containing protein [Kofleriaceae bacterium]|nr:carboxypeptidase regulatory-like domain-containing protein [Kofleriaceae bacterium]
MARARTLIAVMLAAPAAHAAPATGAVGGVVRFDGPAPERAPLARDRDPVCAREPMLAEEIVVTAGKLRDVHVRIRSGTAGVHRAPEAPVVIDQTACMYRPRVVGIMAGQKLVVRNSDPTFHNVHGSQAGSDLFNDAQPARQPAIERPVTVPAGEVLALRCDVHPWMRAFVAVTDHPFFAVTGADGAFTIAGLPPGRYTLEAWHPVLGLRTAAIRVRAGKTAHADFAFQASNSSSSAGTAPPGAR